MKKIEFTLGTVGSIIAITALLAGGFFLGKATAQKPTSCFSVTK